MVFLEDEPQESYVAYAGACRIGSDNRPVVGGIAFNVGYLGTRDYGTDENFEDLLEVTLHELTHVLGFSSFIINNYFKDENGN